MITSTSSTLGHPFLATDNPESTTFVGGLRLRAQTAWRRRCFKRIQQAIRTYDSEKHLLSPVFRPVAGPATMRMANREIERNKLPFNPESGRPWLANAHAKSPLQLVPVSGIEMSALPRSLRGLPQDASNLTMQPEEELPIILIT